VATQAICAPSNITQPEAQHLAGLAADSRSNWLPTFTIANMDRPGTEPGESWTFNARATAGSRDTNMEKFPDMGTYKVNRRTAEVIDAATGSPVASFKELKAAQAKLLKAHCLDAQP
jgi:hypothetical protein